MKNLHKHLLLASFLVGAILLVGAVSLFFFSQEILEKEGNLITLRFQKYLRRAEVVAVDPGVNSILNLDGLDVRGSLFLSEGKIYFNEEGKDPVALSPDHLEVTELLFRDRSEFGLPVKMVFALEEKPGNWFARLLSLPQLYLEEGKALVFDSDIVPVPGSNIRVGINPGDVTSINNTIFFTAGGGNMGINTSTPNERLVIEGGGIKFTNPSARPDCNEARRGTIWFTHGNGAGTADKLSACFRSNAGVFYWADYQGL